MTDMKFYYYDSSFYVAVVSDIFMAFDFHDGNQIKNSNICSNEETTENKSTNREI